MRPCIALSTLVLVAGCAGGPVPRGDTPDTSLEAQTPSQTVPWVDHHQHLLSPAGAELTSSPVLPEIQLPETLAGLLRERERRWNDKARLAELYVDDVLVFSGGNPGWVRGRQAAAAYLSQHFDGPYRFIPTALRSDDSTGQLVGIMEEADRIRTDKFAFFHIGVSRGGDGVWLIASEAHIFPGPLVKAPETARQLVATMDQAGIRRAVVLSDAYYFGTPRSVPVQDEYGKVRAENGRGCTGCSRDHRASLGRGGLFGVCSGHLRGCGVRRRSGDPEPLLRCGGGLDREGLGGRTGDDRQAHAADRAWAHPLRIRRGERDAARGLGGVSDGAAADG